MENDTKDNDLKENDPYNNMETAQDDIQPEFLKDLTDSKKRKDKIKKKVTDTALKVAELAAAAHGAPVGEAGAVGAAGGAGGAEAAGGAGGGAASAISKKAGGVSGLKEGEESPDSLFTGEGKSSFSGLKSKFKMSKMSLAVVVIFALSIGAAVVAMIGTPIFMIGNIDFNLQKALGFSNTVEILTKQGEHIVGEQMAKGEMSDSLAGDLAGHGLMVGQVTETGDFVRTNVYIAKAEDLKDLAVLGNFQVQPSNGELAMLYDGKVITADEFVAAVESNPKMYADYSDATDIPAKYYYSNEVDSVYNDMGLSRGAFSEWVDSGDEEKNTESFNEILEKILNNNSNLTVGADKTEEGGDGDEEQGDTQEQNTSQGGDSGIDISNMNSASQIIEDVTKKTSSNSKASQLLNAAISAGEPYLAASAFLAIEEPIQRARIDGDGPVHEVMNMLNEETKVSYTDVRSHEEKETENSILTTGNFVSAVSAGEYSLGEAINYSRDRAINTMQMSDSSLIQGTAVSTDGQKSSKVGISLSLGDASSYDNINILEDTVDKAIVQSNYDLMRSAVGGNRIVEGGSFLSTSINGRVVGAMPSDAGTIAEYHREVKEVMARRAEAERATKSPFDISSPYTFMGSLAHNMASAMVRNHSSSNDNSGSVIGSLADLTNDSIKGIWNDAVADGDDDSYEMTFGDYCETVNSASVEADIYCTAHRTISTGYMNKTEEEWKSALGDNLDESGNIRDKSGLSDFVKYGMERKATVGVQSADVCNATGSGSIFSGFIKALLGACANVETGVATGSKYAFREGDSDMKVYGGYVLYDTVSSLLNDSTSNVSVYKEKYYKEHPLDNSRAGKIARISGMTKAEAEIALAYADYLSFIAKYNPAQRYAFGEKLIMEKQYEPLVEHSNTVAVDLYVMWHGKVEYDDLRNRTQVV